jgi:hypothetical protein
VTGRSVTGAEARHRIANLLHTYTDIADRKDVDAAVALLGTARVRFPAGGSGSPGRRRASSRRCGPRRCRTGTT